LPAFPFHFTRKQKQNPINKRRTNNDKNFALNFCTLTPNCELGPLPISVSIFFFLRHALCGGSCKYLITTLITAMTTAATVITTIITRAAIYQSCYKKLPFLATFAQLKLGLKTPAQTRPHGMNECH